MEDLEKIIVSKLFHSAWIKLQILNTNPSSMEKVLDETGSYSIRQILEQKMCYMQAVHSCLMNYSDESLLDTSVELIRTSIESVGSENIFDLEKYERHCKEKRMLSRQLSNVRRLQDLTHHDYLEEYTLEFSKNIFVERWESSRMEQLLKQLQDCYHELRQSTCSAEDNIKKARKACTLIDYFYSWQLDKVENDIDQWMERFEREKEDLDNRFQRARASERHWEALKEDFKRREEEIERLQLLENEHHKRIDFKELCWNSAVKVQAWWRGVIVRKGIKLNGKTKRRTKKIKPKKGKKSKPPKKVRK